MKRAKSRPRPTQPPASSPLRILVADDHELVRRGLTLVLEDAFGRIEIGEAVSSQEALRQVADRKWDIVLLDLNMPGSRGLDLLAEIRRLRPKLPVLVLSASSEAEYGFRTLKAGAAGYVNKQHASEELVLAVREALAGRTYVGSATARKLAENLRGDAVRLPHEKLSDRELEVFHLIARGRSAKEIAGELRLSEKTVGTYVARIKDKTGLRGPVEITRYAFQNKLAD